MQQRRLTRLVNGFSKKRRNHGAALALHFAWYNFCRIHETIRVTPAMAAGLTDHVWDVEELVQRALSEPVPAPAPLAPVPSPDGWRWRRPEQLSLFDRAAVPPLLPKLLPPSAGGTAEREQQRDPGRGAGGRGRGSAAYRARSDEVGRFARGRGASGLISPVPAGS